MYRKSIGSFPEAEAQFDFQLCDVVGIWQSNEGAPDIRIYQDSGRKGGVVYVELAYRDGVCFTRPVRKYWNGLRYFDLYGLIGMAYNNERDVLQLSTYGDYYRKEEY